MAAAEAEAEDATWKSSDEVSADRFSDLPAHIVHDIMSLLPTGDATRMSAVSKTFESMWRSFPIIDLDLYLFKSSSHKLRVGNFLNYLSNTIQSRQIETSVEKFRICVRFIHPRHYRLFNKAISYALDKGVNEFHLDMDLRGFYRVPAAIENAKSITNLSLQGCRLNLSGVLLGCPAIENLRIIRCEILTDNVKFSSHVIRTFELQESYGMKGNQINSSTLQVFKFTEFPEDCVIMLSNPETLRFLSVTGAVVTDKWFQDNVSKACLMESLELSRNTMLTDVKLSSANLKSIVFRECTAVNKIEFGSMNLHSFIYAYMQPSKVNVDCFRNLKNLELNYSDSNQVMANAIVSEMPGLERLTLEGCKGLKMVEICHKHLKNLQLKYCINLTFVKIDTPGLVSFTYRGRLLPLHLINCKPLLVDAEFSFWIEAVSVGKLFFDLRNMISQFDHTKSLTLRFSYGEPFIFPLEEREKLLPPLYDVKHLTIEMNFFWRRYSELVDSLLWMSSCPETLHFVLNNERKSLKFQYAKRVPKEEDLLCGWGWPVKSWQYYLESVEMENFNGIKEREDLLKYFRENARGLHTVSHNSKVL